MDGTRADKAALLAHALKRTGAEPGQAVMLGDREHDINGARNNGVAGIGALWGFGTREELQAAGAVQLAASPEDAADRITAL